MPVQIPQAVRKYKFGDISRRLYKWYTDHPNSLPHRIDWWKVERLLISTLVVSGFTNFGEVAAKAVYSAMTPQDQILVTVVVSSVYAIIDAVIRLSAGGNKDAQAAPAPAPSK